MRIKNLILAAVILRADMGLSQGYEVKKELIATEEITVFLKGLPRCRHTYGTIEAYRQTFPDQIYFEQEDLFDKSMLVVGISPQAYLPYGIKCSEIEKSLEMISNELVAVRKIYRETRDWPNGFFTKILIETSIEIPLNINGKNLVLFATSEWLEDGLVTGNKQIRMPLPHEAPFAAHASPLPRNNTRGLICQKLPESEKYLLIIDIEYWTTYSNAKKALQVHEDENSCEKTRSKLLRHFIEEDPNNNQYAIFEGSRRIDHSFIRALDNHDNEICEEVETETITLFLGDEKFSEEKTCAVRTVAIKKCLRP